LSDKDEASKELVDLAIQNSIFMASKKSQFLDSYGEQIISQLLESKNVDSNKVQALFSNIIMNSASKSNITKNLNNSFIEKLIEDIHVTILNLC